MAGILMNILDLLTFIIVALIAFIAFSIRKYAGTYFAEKGRNLATKEDIATITKNIESVKSDIQTLGQIRTDYEKQRREWLLKFHDSAIELLHDKLSTDFGDFPYDNGQSFFNYQKEFHANVIAIFKNYQRIVIYFDHEAPVRCYAENILEASQKAKKFVSKGISPLKRTIFEEQEALSSGEKERLNAAIIATDKANTEFWDKMNPIKEEFIDTLRPYINELNILFRSDGSTKTKI